MDETDKREADALKSRRILTFTIPGKVLGRGAWSCYRNYRLKDKQSDEWSLKHQYYNNLKLVARTAMSEQRWKEPTKKPLYVVAVAYTQPNYKVLNKILKSEEYQDSYHRQKMSVSWTMHPPFLHALVMNVCRALNGIVYESPNQVVATLFVKKFNPKPRLEVLVGVVGSYKELLHDLRNI